MCMLASVGVCVRVRVRVCMRMGVFLSKKISIRYEISSFAYMFCDLTAILLMLMIAFIITLGEIM